VFEYPETFVRIEYNFIPKMIVEKNKKLQGLGLQNLKNLQKFEGRLQRV